MRLKIGGDSDHCLTVWHKLTKANKRLRWLVDAQVPSNYAKGVEINAATMMVATAQQVGETDVQTQLPPVMVVSHC